MVAAVAHKRLSSQSAERSVRSRRARRLARHAKTCAGEILSTMPPDRDCLRRITELPEYYPTRCEMKHSARPWRRYCKAHSRGAALVEFGSGSSKKARILLSAAPKLAAYVPVDICGEMIEQEAAELRPDFPAAQGVAGDGRYLQTV